MELQITIPNQSAKKAMVVSDKVFGCEYNEPLIHQIVTACRAAERAGTAKQKSRSEVIGSKRKLWKQKGTGRARVGSGKVNIWRGGGMAFPARPMDYSQKVNKKMYRAAMRSIISELLRDGRMITVENFSIDEAKTKIIVKKLKDMAIENALIVMDEIDERVALAARNIPTVEVCAVSAINPIALFLFKKIIITEAAVKKVEEWLA